MRVLQTVPLDLPLPSETFDVPDLAVCMYAFHHDRSHRNYPRRVWRETMRCLRAKVSAIAHAIGAQLWAPLAQIAATTQCTLAIARTRATVIISKSLAACIGRPFASAVCFFIYVFIYLFIYLFIHFYC